jgi:peptidoglycan-N-acetylglucosamine deacetylase
VARSSQRWIVTLAIALAILTTNDAAQSTRTIALTFDDLPFVHKRGDYLPMARATTTALLDTLRRYQAPAVGFVNEINVEREREARVALLNMWIAAGMALGNHTYSHPDLNRVTIDQFQNEIVRGERTIRELQPNARLYFRHPMTRSGNTPEKKKAIDAFLIARGYRIAPHTIENSDFVFNTVYAAAQSRKDEGLAAKVRQAYLDHTFAATAFAETISPMIFSREIPQTLLLHANELNADTLDEMLRRYRERGYRFISLDQAMADPAYATPDTLVTDFGPTWLWRWRTHLGLNVSFAGDPEPPAWVIALFNQ